MLFKKKNKKSVYTGSSVVDDSGSEENGQTGSSWHNDSCKHRWAEKHKHAQARGGFLHQQKSTSGFTPLSLDQKSEAILDIQIGELKKERKKSASSNKFLKHPTAKPWSESRRDLRDFIHCTASTWSADLGRSGVPVKLASVYLASVTICVVFLFPAP